MTKEQKKTIKKEIEKVIKKELPEIHGRRLPQKVTEKVEFLIRQIIQRFIEETLEQTYREIWRIEKKSGGIPLADSAKFDIYYQKQVKWLKRKFMTKKKEKATKEINKYPSINKILLKATQHAYKVGKVKGKEYRCFYPEIENEIDALLARQKQEMVKKIDKMKKNLPVFLSNLSLKELTLEQADYRGKCLGYNQALEDIKELLK